MTVFQEFDGCGAADLFGDCVVVGALRAPGRYQVTVFRDSAWYDADLLGGCVIVSALRAARHFISANKAPTRGRRVRVYGRAARAEQIFIPANKAPIRVQMQIFDPEASAQAIERARSLAFYCW